MTEGNLPMNETQVETIVKEVIDKTIARYILRGWGMILMNFVVFLGGLVAINTWKKDIEFALKDLNGIPAKVQVLDTWKAERILKGEQWQADISNLKAHDDQQGNVLLRLLEGQAEIKARMDMKGK